MEYQYEECLLRRLRLKSVKQAAKEKGISEDDVRQHMKTGMMDWCKNPLSENGEKVVVENFKYTNRRPVRKLDRWRLWQEMKKILTEDGALKKKVKSVPTRVSSSG